MELAVAADVAIDLATKDDLDQHHQNIRKMFEKPRGRPKRISATGAVGAGSPTSNQQFAFVPWGPVPGEQWQIQWANVWQIATDPLAPPTAGSIHAALCIGRCATGPGAQTMVTLADIHTDDIVAIFPLFTSAAGNFTSIPGSIGVPDKTFVRPDEQLYILLTGSGFGAQGTIYGASAGIIITPDTEEAVFW